MTCYLSTRGIFICLEDSVVRPQNVNSHSGSEHDLFIRLFLTVAAAGNPRASFRSAPGECVPEFLGKESPGSTGRNVCALRARGHVGRLLASAEQAVQLLCDHSVAFA